MTSHVPDPLAPAPLAPTPLAPAPAPAGPAAASAPTDLGTAATATAGVQVPSRPVARGPQPPDATGRAYHHAYAGYPGARWRSVLALLVAAVLFMVVNVVLSLPVLAIEGFDSPASGRVSPLLLAATMLSLAALTPISMLVQRMFFLGTVPLSSVTGGLRWGLLGRMAMVVVPLLAVLIGLETLFVFPPGGGRGQAWLGYLLVSALLLPFQAAGEEYGFRGLTNRLGAAWSLNPNVAFGIGAVVSAVAFALAHVAADPWLNAYYAVVGISLAVVARLTGGLEGPIVIHAGNNVVAGVFGALTSDMGSMYNRGVGSAGPFMLAQMAVVLLMSAVTVVIARRERAATVIS